MHVQKRYFLSQVPGQVKIPFLSTRQNVLDFPGNPLRGLRKKSQDLNFRVLGILYIFDKMFWFNVKHFRLYSEYPNRDLMFGTNSLPRVVVFV